MIDKLLGVVIGALAAWAGYHVGLQLSPHLAEYATLTVFGHTVVYSLLGAILGLLFGLLIAPWMIGWFWRSVSWFDAKLSRMPFVDIIFGALGLIIGLIIANLIASAFSHLPVIGYFLPMLASLFFGYIGMTLAIKKREEIIGLWGGFPWIGKERSKEGKYSNLYPYKLLDTSVIIDGRIADICNSGFIEGIMIIPLFVLEELQRIADSSDSLKRNRGRRGLEMLDRLQKEFGHLVQIDNRDFDDISEVDSKLIKLAQVMKAKVVTNDYNLNKVAQIQGVSVLNINELSNSVKPVMMPGEEMVVHVIKDGKEQGQGVAYLDDGTMIVVDGGKKHIGESVGVMVTSVLQTAAGRMIFAKPKAMERAL